MPNTHLSSDDIQRVDDMLARYDAAASGDKRGVYIAFLEELKTEAINEQDMLGINALMNRNVAITMYVHEAIQQKADDTIPGLRRKIAELSAPIQNTDEHRPG